MRHPRHSVATSSGSSGCPYQLYMYDLPHTFRRNGKTNRAPRSLHARDLAQLNGDPYICCGVLAAEWLPHFPRGVKLWNSAQFSTAQIVYERVKNHRCRTYDPQRADLFFIPSWSILTPQLPSSDCALHWPNSSLYLATSGLYRALRRVQVKCSFTDSSECSALDRRGGADHVLLSPRNGAPMEIHPICELDYSDARLGASTRLAIEEPSRGRWRWWDHYATHELYHSTPHVSNVHLDASAEAAPWRSRHERHILAVAAFGVGHGNDMNIKIRRRLQDQCAAAASSDCTVMSVWEKKDHALFMRTNRSVGAAEPAWVSLARLHWNSTFSLQPPGDAVSRKGVADSLVLGCIPVLFHTGLALQWPDHWGSWQ